MRAGLSQKKKKRVGDSTRPATYVVSSQPNQESKMSVELANALSSLISVDNLEEAQMQADLLNAAGIFLTVFGFVVGGAMIGATTAIVGLGARLMSDDINNRIDQEISRRASLTSKNLHIYSDFSQNYILIIKNVYVSVCSVPILMKLCMRNLH